MLYRIYKLKDNNIYLKYIYNTHFSLAIWILDILEVGSSISITLSVTDSEINFRLIKEIAYLKEINSTQF